MKKFKISRTRATLNSRYWKKYFSSIRHCYQCGGALVSRYIKDENARRKVCSKCGIITYLNPRVVVGLIPRARGGKIILMRRNIEPGWGRWIYPGGFVEMGETLEQAAIRETKEEIGIDVAVTRQIGIYSYQDAGVVTVVFEGRVLKNQAPKTTVEALEVSLFNIGDIPWRELAFRSTVDALEDYKTKWKQKRV